jgi:DNA-binding FadR family transcriptional regulator
VWGRLHEAVLHRLDDAGLIDVSRVVLDSAHVRAREVAESLGVNVHTVLRGYQQLRHQGLIELRRGRGAVINAAPDVADQARLAEAVHGLITQARNLGFSDQELLAVVHNSLSGAPVTTPPPRPGP